MDVVALPQVVDIVAAEQLAHELLDASVVDATAVSRIDAIGLQLLVAAKLARSFVWRGYSPAVVSGAQTLGLAHVLGLPTSRGDR